MRTSEELRGRRERGLVVRFRACLTAVVGTDRLSGISMHKSTEYTREKPGGKTAISGPAQTSNPRSFDKNFQKLRLKSYEGLDGQQRHRRISTLIMRFNNVD